MERNSGLIRSVRRRTVEFPEQVKGLMSLAMNLTFERLSGISFMLCEFSSHSSTKQMKHSLKHDSVSSVPSDG